jgi:preprotein translocase subunit SecG
MLGLILGLILVISVLLVMIILAQNSKGGGLSSQFGGSATSQIMGVKRTGDLLEKLTWGFAIAILVLSLGANKIIDKRQANQGTISPNIEAAQQKQTIQNFAPNISGEAEEAIETLEVQDSSASE